MLHAFLALVAGFAVTVLLAMGLTALVVRLAPGWAETRSGLRKLGPLRVICARRGGDRPASSSTLALHSWLRRPAAT